MTDILADSNASILPLIDKKKAKKFMEAPKEYGKPWFGQLMAGPQLLAYFTSSITGWRNIIFLCDRKKHSGTFTLSGVFFVYLILKLFYVFSDTPCIPALRSVSP